MSLVRKFIVKIAYLRPGENAGPQRLVKPRDMPRLMADTAEAAWLAKRRFEKLSRKVVTFDAYGMWKILGHRLIGVFGLLLSREMTIGALDLYVLLLIVRKAPMAGSVFGLFKQQRSGLTGTRRTEPDIRPEHYEGAQRKQTLKIADGKLQIANLRGGPSNSGNFHFAILRFQFSILS